MPERGAAARARGADDIGAGSCEARQSSRTRAKGSSDRSEGKEENLEGSKNASGVQHVEMKWHAMRTNAHGALTARRSA